MAATLIRNAAGIKPAEIDLMPLNWKEPESASIGIPLKIMWYKATSKIILLFIQALQKCSA